MKRITLLPWIRVSEHLHSQTSYLSILRIFEEIGSELKYTYAKMIFAKLSDGEIKELVDEYNQKFGG